MELITAASVLQEGGDPDLKTHVRPHVEVD